jgi:hypothetical protein
MDQDDLLALAAACDRLAASVTEPHFQAMFGAMGAAYREQAETGVPPIAADQAWAA